MFTQTHQNVFIFTCFFPLSLTHTHTLKDTGMITCGTHSPSPCALCLLFSPANQLWAHKHSSIRSSTPAAICWLWARSLTCRSRPRERCEPVGLEIQQFCLVRLHCVSKCDRPGLADTFESHHSRGDKCWDVAVACRCGFSGWLIHFCITFTSPSIWGNSNFIF